MNRFATEHPEVSVVIPVRDNAEGIAEMVACLEAQTFPRERFEIIIGDDGSRSSQLEMVREPGRIRVVKCPPRNSYAARNAAASRARGAILAFCDSDCLPEPEWLEKGIAALEGRDLVGGQIVFIAPEPHTIWSLLTIDMFLDQQRDLKQASAVTANLLVRREWFEQLQGFDQSLASGGDYDFVQRAVTAGATVQYAGDSIVRHPTMDTAKSFLRRVWFSNYWSGIRGARPGKPAVSSARLAPRWLILPVAGVVLARIYAARPPFGLYEQRLRAYGLKPTIWDHARAAVLMHFLICYVAGAARISGWWKGRRFAREGRTAIYRTRVPLTD